MVFGYSFPGCIHCGRCTRAACAREGEPKCQLDLRSGKDCDGALAPKDAGAAVGERAKWACAACTLHNNDEVKAVVI